MSSEGKKTAKETRRNFSKYDFERKWTLITPLVNGKECIYVNKENVQ